LQPTISLQLRIHTSDAVGGLKEISLTRIILQTNGVRRQSEERLQALEE